MINGKEVEGYAFAYDGCHKIYIIEDERDEIQAEDAEYDIYPIDELQEIFESSCPLKFIHNWKLEKTYVEQFEEAVFE